MFGYFNNNNNNNFLISKPDFLDQKLIWQKKQKQNQNLYARLIVYRVVFVISSNLKSGFYILPFFLYLFFFFLGGHLVVLVILQPNIIYV